jgi:hypothetical protein
LLAARIDERLVNAPGHSDGQLWAERPGGDSLGKLWIRSAEAIKLRSSV